MTDQLKESVADRLLVAEQRSSLLGIDQLCVLAEKLSVDAACRIARKMEKAYEKGAPQVPGCFFPRHGYCRGEKVIEASCPRNRQH